MQSTERGTSGTIYRLRLKDLIAAVHQEGFTFLLVLLYLFIEYVRPQTVYPAIDIIPYGKVVIVAALSAYFLQTEKTRVRNVSNVLMLCFFAIIIFSSLLALSPETSFINLTNFVSWMLIYFLITKTVTNERRYLLFTLLFLLCSFRMAQFSLRGWISGGLGYSTRGFGGGSGWFHNSGEFGIQMCIYFPIAFYFYSSLYRQWPRWKRVVLAALPITAFTGMFTSSNRGTLLGGAAVLAVIFLRSRRKVTAFIAVLLVVFISFKLIPEKQMNRFREAGQDSTSVSRLENWKKGLKMAEMNPLFGIGYKNWQIADAKYFDGKGLLSHNIFIECMSELGYSGLAVFLLLICATVSSNARTRRLVAHRATTTEAFLFNMANALDASLVGYLVTGFFVTVFYYPFFWINLSMAVSLNQLAKNSAADYRLGHNPTPAPPRYRKIPVAPPAAQPP